MTDIQASTILVVDDDPGARDALANVLSDEGYRVASAANGLEALAYLRSETPSLILLDLMMPVMDGWEFRSRQKLDPVLSSIPVVVITARPPREAPGDAAGVIRKPIDLDSLLSTVKKYCEG